MHLFKFFMMCIITSTLGLNQWSTKILSRPQTGPCGCAVTRDPVCGLDGRTYGNQCLLECGGVGLDCIGECNCITGGSSYTPTPVVDINRSAPPYQTYPASEPEHKLWYFREDPGLSSHYNHWHGLFSQTSRERRGEFFFYMHRQLINRYNIERLTHNLGVVEPLSPDTWDKPIPLGYFPNLMVEVGVDYQGRLDNMSFQPRRDDVLYYRYQEIKEALENRQVVIEDEAIIPLQASGGRDEGISVFGDLLSDLHNLGLIFLGLIMDPAGSDLSKLGVVGNPATRVRDPVFFRWLQFTNNIFTQYKASLPPYTEEELGFPGVEILSSQVSTNGRIGELHTMMDKWDVLLHKSNTSFKARYNRLNHQPFQYSIQVRSEHLSTKAMVRIFLIPGDSPPDPDDPTALMIEMDRFVTDLKNGINTIDRKSSQSTVIDKRPETLLELHKDLADEKLSDEVKLYNGCGWPAHLLVPKGTATGQVFAFVVVLSKLLPGDAALTVEPEKIGRSSFVQCGMPGVTIMPDSRPMGFPYDRPVMCDTPYCRERLQGNMAKTYVTIFHHDGSPSQPS